MDQLTAFTERLVKKRRFVAVHSQPETSYPVGSSWVLDYLASEAMPRNPLPEKGYLLERTVSCMLFTTTALAAAVMYGNAPVTGSGLCAVLGLGVEMVFLSWCYKKLPAIKDRRTASVKIKELQYAIFGLTSDLNKINDLKQKFQQIEEDKIKDLLRRQREASEEEKKETKEVEKELRSQVSEIAGERQKIDQEEKTELAGALASFQKTWLEDQFIKHRISKEKILDLDDDIIRRLRSSGIRTAADFLNMNLFQSYGRKKIEKVYLILKNGGSVHVGMSPSQAKALMEWRKKLERKYRPKMPLSIPRSEITAIKSKFNERKTVLNDVEQNYKSRAQHMISNIRKFYFPVRDLLKREEDTIRTNLISELFQFDKEATMLNKHFVEKQWELHHLGKQLESLKDVNFLKFLRRVFFFS